MKLSIKILEKFIPLLSFILLTPMVTYAAGSYCNAIGGLGGILCRVSSLLSSALPVLIALGVIYFIWGVVQYVIGDSDEAKTKGRDKIIYGIIGLTVIISVWGLVFLLADTLGVGGESAPAYEISNLVAVPTTSSCFLDNDPKFPDLLNYFTCTINDSVIPLIFAIAVVMFVWGAVKFFIINSDEEAKREQGKQFMLWSIIALAAMLSIWGLVGILRSTFNLNSGSFLPQVKP